MFTKVNRITKTVRIDAELSTMENVIMDTAKYSEFIGSIERVEMLEESESTNKAKFFARLTIPFSYVIKTEKLSSQTFRFEQTDGFFQSLKGDWYLEPRTDYLEATYAIEVRLPIFVPSEIVHLALNSYFPKMLENFIQRASSLQKNKKIVPS